MTELVGLLFPDPGDHFATSQADASDLTLMEPEGPTPKKDAAKGRATGGSSYL